MLAHACDDDCLTIGDCVETLYEVLGLDRAIGILVV
jgi:hypothetical protein